MALDARSDLAQTRGSSASFVRPGPVYGNQPGTQIDNKTYLLRGEEENRAHQNARQCDARNEMTESSPRSTGDQNHEPSEQRYRRDLKKDSEEEREEPVAKIEV